MTPYRTAAPGGGPKEERPVEPVGDDEPLLAWLGFALGAVRVGVAIATGEDWGAEASIAGLLMIVGLVGIVRGRAGKRLRKAGVEPSAGIVAIPRNEPRTAPAPTRSTGDGRILIVEDDPSLRGFLRLTLCAEGFQVEEAGSLADAFSALRNQPALVLLDLGLPDGDGLELLRSLGGSAGIPVIAMSARGREDDRGRVLDAGARDYLAKPFVVEELLDGVRAALLQRSDDSPDRSVFDVGPIHLDVVQRQVTLSGRPVALSETEFRLLAVLTRHAGRIQTHRALLREVWGPGSQGDTASLRAHMATLRRKLEVDPARPRWLLTEPGVGYRLRRHAN